MPQMVWGDPFREFLHFQGVRIAGGDIQRRHGVSVRVR
jgi:hypothetical protein